MERSNGVPVEINVDDSAFVRGLAKAKRALESPGLGDVPGYRYFIHPDNYAWLMRELEAVHGRPAEQPPFVTGQPFDPTFFGIEIATSEFVPRRGRRWQFPDWPFVDFDQADEEWCVPLDFGRWVETDDRPILRLLWPPLVSPLRSKDRYGWLPDFVRTTNSV